MSIFFTSLKIKYRTIKIADYPLGESIDGKIDLGKGNVTFESGGEVRLDCKIMRSNVDPQKIEQLMKALGREARGSGCIYFTGGASALLIGWRSSTVDIDIRLDPEPPGIFQAIAKLKQELDINIELASPQDFLPQLPGWRDRSVFIGRQGEISFYHYDFTAQALSKLSRGYNRDIDDVRAMYEQKLFTLEKLRDCFDEIESELIRFPSLDADLLRNKIEQFIDRCESISERDK
jgi:hypothetical protein